MFSDLHTLHWAPDRPVLCAPHGLVGPDPNVIDLFFLISFPKQSCNEKVSYPHENRYFKTVQTGAWPYTTSCRHAAGDAYPAIPAI